MYSFGASLTVEVEVTLLADSASYYSGSFDETSMEYRGRSFPP